MRLPEEIINKIRLWLLLDMSIVVIIGFAELVVFGSGAIFLSGIFAIWIHGVFLYFTKYGGSFFVEEKKIDNDYKKLLIIGITYVAIITGISVIERVYFDEMRFSLLFIVILAAHFLYMNVKNG